MRGMLVDEDAALFRFGDDVGGGDLAAWLERHRLFGPMLSNWRNGKLIARSAKISATVTMLICAVMMLVLLTHNWWIYFAVAGMVLVNLWIWSRPEPGAQRSECGESSGQR